MNNKINQIYTKAKAHISIIFFICGFLFDLITLGRIDQGFVLIQQAIFLIVILLILHLEINERIGKTYPEYISKYKTYLMHFLIGALLSAFLIFYFISASGLNALFFIITIIALMVINELPQFQKLNISFKTSLFSICLISYLAYLTPTLLGYIGIGPLLLSAIIYFLVLIFNCIVIGKRTDDYNLIKKFIIVPSLSVLVIFLGLYFAKIIPPVPVSIKKIGIYRNVEKNNGKYILSYARHPLKFWQSHEADFSFSKGDKVYCFASIFSPTAFSDKVLFEWNTYINNKWTVSDQLPLRISGGRDGGFRAFTFKSNMSPGKWRVKVLTVDKREIGSLTFNVMEQENPFEIRQDQY